jgi:hypothetical protein
MSLGGVRCSCFEKALLTLGTSFDQNSPTLEEQPHPLQTSEKSCKMSDFGKSKFVELQMTSSWIFQYRKKGGLFEI